MFNSSNTIFSSSLQNHNIAGSLHKNQERLHVETYTHKNNLST